MYRLDSLSDWIVYFLACTLVTAMGVAFLVSPVPPLPTQLEAYVQKSGVLDVVVASSTRSKGAWAQFRLVDDPAIYESRARHINEKSSSWQSRRTPMSFYVVRQSERAGTSSDPELAYGLIADGVATSSLAADINYINSATSGFGGVFALVVGLLGYGVGLLAWIRKRAENKRRRR